MAEDPTQVFKQTQVASIDDPKPARLTVEGLTGEELWLTEIKGDVSPNFQLMHAVGKGAYLNAFNQRLSPFEITGVYVASSCDGSAPAGEPEFLKFYKERNIVASPDPLRLTYNGITITGFLTRLVLGKYSQDKIDGHKFTLKFLGVIDTLADQTFEFGGEFTDISQSASDLSDAARARLGAENTEGAGESAVRSSNLRTPEQIAAERNLAEIARDNASSPGLQGDA